MSNIWEFLLQTMEVSLTAAILLMLKWLFQDKLSPRWQYGVWTILAIKLLMPASFSSRYVSLDAAAALDVCKRNVERQLTSQFSDAYMVIEPSVGIPNFMGVPQSITDWLFILYIAGVIGTIGYYLWGYLRLKLALRNGWAPGEALQTKLDAVYQQYQLKPCKTIVIDSMESAFVCGFFRPILVVPAYQEETIDEKVLLHELMHKKYFDGWQNGFWCLMRCIHWCNPFLHFGFNRIGNDMESLCDQRVLERIEGEARRDYGRILLDMTNQKYARAMGTTSLSNGGQNIKKRIEAIVRFKKYPKGMGLVSFCICLLVASPVFGGTTQTLNFTEDITVISNEDVRLAKFRLQGCSTVAGAIDTYIKGMLRDDISYITAVTPAAQQYRADSIAVSNEIWPIYDEYLVLNLKEQEDGSMEAYVLLYEAEGEEEYERYDVLAVPIKSYQENRHWVVEENGAPFEYKADGYPVWNYQDPLPALHTYEEECETGTILLQEQSYHYVQIDTVNEWGWFYENTGSAKIVPDPDTPFSRHELHYQVTYTHDKEKGPENVETLSISARSLTKASPEPNWSEDAFDLMKDYSESASDDGSAIIVETMENRWRGEQQLDTGLYRTEKGIDEVKAYAIRIYINKVRGEYITIEREEASR